MEAEGCEFGGGGGVGGVMVSGGVTPTRWEMGGGCEWVEGVGGGEEDEAGVVEKTGCYGSAF